ncbi:ER membrane glycoprotein subunit of the GPI transamidase complex-like protein [Yamadazyma tenuis]|uniref:GPI mannosyltransferase 2 n=1 Tax=Candida tenuis (strain ATCC 10573 / BCRC 21748 / CBS 615 / JCM 9827 / NBRC 10315 / NRRL Y-1498 / VKM Y-70) TaxID=590646 RepID=G3B4J3_CANTC|nr:mannosyltransferase [Yamadazyma tenuis ATCC 10573]EGV63959.1 mannosyltransferase [Yamadazyma tenuis ATCC 10573]WEJ96426.1 ER membrane glycoprotein subunit of the GPI transamidase complex-like protein [Yamadazyma tenuis]
MWKTFLALKLAQLVVLYNVPAQFDVSSDILIESYSSDRLGLPIIDRLLDGFLIWDNVYFTDLFKNDIKYEHQFVFSPGWVALIRYIASLLPTQNFYVLLAIATVVSNVCQLMACQVLYVFSRKMFEKMPFFGLKSKDLAHKAALYYILSPGGIFLTASYSENLGSLLSILALYLREVSISYSANYHLKVRLWAVYIFSGIVLAAAFQVRANCLLLGIFYLYDLERFWRASEVSSTIISFVSGIPLFVSFVYTNYVGYKTFCPGRGEWCNHVFPSLFQYCQVHYWNNGFLNYWTPNNIPNFIISSPIVATNVYLIWYFYTKYPSHLLIPYLLLNAILVVLGVLFWNIQILNRILNFNPVFYWFLAVIDNKMIRRGLLFWILIQAGLFGAFLPPA